MRKCCNARLDPCGVCLNTRIRSGFSGKGVVWGPFDVSTPDGMSTTQFGQSLVSTAAGYQNNLVPYSLPLNSAGILPRGGWNSGSWVSGLLQTVGGYAPQYNFSPFIAPGYSNPVPGRVYGGR